MTKIWEFNTDRFSVQFHALPEYDLDLSWDETGEVADKIEHGIYAVFCAAIFIELDDQRIAESYLGQCIYENPEDFIDHRGLSETATKERAHREIQKAKNEFARRSLYLRGKLNRGEISRRYYERSIQPARDALRQAAKDYQHCKQYAGKCGSYFSDMVQEAIKEAREYVNTMQKPPKMRHAA